MPGASGRVDSGRLGPGWSSSAARSRARWTPSAPRRTKAQILRRSTGVLKLTSKPDIQHRQLQVGQHLGLMDRQQMIDGLELHYKLLFDDDVESVAAVELDPFVDDWHRSLPHEAQVRERQFMAQAFFIGGFQEPGTEVTMNLDARSEDSLGQIPQPPGLSIAVVHIVVIIRSRSGASPDCARWTSRAVHRAHTTRRRRRRTIPSLTSPPPRLPVNLFLLLIPPNQPVQPTVRAASQARQPAPRLTAKALGGERAEKIHREAGRRGGEK